jgi:hypothetical protein
VRGVAELKVAERGVAERENRHAARRLALIYIMVLEFHKSLIS